MVEIDPDTGPIVRRIFAAYAYESLTLDGLIEKLAAEGFSYRTSFARFPRSSVHNILKDRSYIGEIPYRGNWYPGKQEPLVDLRTWQRVQTIWEDRFINRTQ